MRPPFLRHFYRKFRYVLSYYTIFARQEQFRRGNLQFIHGHRRRQPFPRKIHTEKAAAFYTGSIRFRLSCRYGTVLRHTPECPPGPPCEAEPANQAVCRTPHWQGQAEAETGRADMPRSLPLCPAGHGQPRFAENGSCAAYKPQETQKQRMPGPLQEGQTNRSGTFASLRPAG